MMVVRFMFRFMFTFMFRFMFISNGVGIGDVKDSLEISHFNYKNVPLQFHFVGP